jgi:hypothetical protein
LGKPGSYGTWEVAAQIDGGGNLLAGIYWSIKVHLFGAFMPALKDPAALIHQLEAILVRLGAATPIWNEAIALVLQLETTLKHLEFENFDPPGSCCSCLQDVPTKGHLPTCDIAQDLEAIRAWKRSFIPGENWN